MDWKQEKENLIERGDANYWKPTTGQHQVNFLSDGEEHTFEWEGEKIPKILFKVETATGPYFWDITRGKTQNSLFGQLVLVANERGNLKGNSVNLVVKGSGKEVSYTILEALPLMKEVERKIEQKQELVKDDKE